MAAATQQQLRAISVVLPGDDVTDQIHQQQQTSNSKKRPKLGMGLRTTTATNDLDQSSGGNNSDDDTTVRVIATCAGRLVQHPNNHTFFVKQNIQKYRPLLEDRVIGIVEERVASDGSGGDIYRVNIGGPHPALLSNLSFEGATKRNKPNLSPGLLLYARIESTPRGLDNNLSCTLGPHDGGVPRKDWMTNEGTYGILTGGTCRKIPLGLARELLYPDNLVLQELGRKNIPFEVCVGVNGMLWVHSSRPEYTILIQNAILNSQVLTEDQVRGMVKSLVETVQQSIREEED
ncbi:KH domain containing protein [Nitzschia inconspicua]|uniref:KH domain containing protein n=1 Tax=Nitzschia inconspicua TaxID=303405 RepID=A0A9K3K6G1_9STRA|nr:KH domain containing protein [Nitzschia inconspicua]KAG7371254.1 KH domain containing protein [Nitzschia inconspicua]